MFTIINKIVGFILFNFVMTLFNAVSCKYFLFIMIAATLTTVNEENNVSYAFTIFSNFN